MTAINKETAVSVPGNADGKLLSLGIRRNRDLIQVRIWKLSIKFRISFLKYL